eukprot:Clim_evm144s147 gene=Clim_evmTU144s147
MADFNEEVARVHLRYILKGVDPQTTSVKQIRGELAEAMGIDLTDHKETVKQLVVEAFHSNSNGLSLTSATASPIPKPSGAVPDIGIKSSKITGITRAKPKAKAKKKKSKPKAKAKAKGKPTKQRTKIVYVDSNGEPIKRQATGGLAKKMQPSETLAEVLGSSELVGRAEVVKRMWEIIRERNLQNPSDRREILCDDTLKKLFGVDKVTIFGMNKYLSKHLKDPDQLTG